MSKISSKFFYTFMVFGIVLCLFFLFTPDASACGDLESADKIVITFTGSLL